MIEALEETAAESAGMLGRSRCRPLLDDWVGERLVSAWDMFNLRLEPFFEVWNLYKEIQDELEKGLANKDDCDAAAEGLVHLAAAVSSLIGSDTWGKSAALVAKRVRAMEEGASHRLGQVLESLQIELARFQYVGLSETESQYLTGQVDETIRGELPSSVDDLEAAARCLAFRCYTASVFHSLRAMEAGLDRFADGLGLTVGGENWGEKLRTVEGVINTHKTLGRRWPDLQFCSEASVDFSRLKDAWRNLVAHASGSRYQFDDRKAERIYSRVSDFLVLLAQRLPASSPSGSLLPSGQSSDNAKG